MKIGIDGRYAEGDLVGVGNYIKNLAEGFVGKNLECYIFYSKKPKFEIKGAKSVILPAINRYVFEQILLPLVGKEKRLMFIMPPEIGESLFFLLFLQF